MSLGNNSETNLLLLLFQNTAWANVGSVAGLQPSSAAGSFYVALHTANPGQAGTQQTSEAGYTGYARVGVARSNAGWTVTGNNPATAENAAAVTFGQSSTGPETEAYASVGVASSGATDYLWFGALTASLVVNNLITPNFPINNLQCQMT